MMHAASISSTGQILRVKNTTRADQELWIEPLGDRVVLRPNVLYELLATDEFGKLEIDLSEDGFVVYGWVRKVISLDEQANETVEWQMPS
jgi:hypothetical protein